MSIAEEVYKVVMSIPMGCVMTYGEVARAVGRPGAARAVGAALHKNSNPEKIPCHRVVFSDGGLSKNYAFGGEVAQREKLEKEGIVFVGDKVELVRN